MSITSVITQIWTGAVRTWNAAETLIDTDVARIKAAFPGAATTIDAIASNLKQGASDAISAADSALVNIAPGVTTGLEAAADAALAKYTGGLALPLVPLTNDSIEKIEALLVSTANGWAMKAKAALAENNTATAATTAH